MIKIIFICTVLLNNVICAELVEVINISKNIKLDIRYATKNNFTGQIIYPSNKCYLQKEAAQALSNAQKDLEKIGLGLKIFDGYRPKSVNKVFWEVLRDRFPNPEERRNFVANPKRGSVHNRGVAVDLTLINLKTGAELEMPSTFDDFSKKAHLDYNNTTEQAKKNRTLLGKIMNKYGFFRKNNEWWHFNFSGWKKYPILNISFNELQKKPLKKTRKNY